MAKKGIEIEVRAITDGKVTETRTVTQKDGGPMERALILAEGEDQSGLIMVNCDKVEACTMIRHNKKMAMIAKVAALGMMLFGAEGDKDNDEEEETDNGELGESQGEKPEDL